MLGYNTYNLNANNFGIKNYKIIDKSNYEHFYSEYVHNKYLSIPIEQITEAKFYDMLEVLPPKQWYTDNNGVNKFCMCEFMTGNITTQYAKYNGKFLKKYVDFKNESTYITINDFNNI